MSFRAPGRNNPIWKTWSKIGRGKDPRFFLEHPDAVKECLNQGLCPEQVLVEESAFEQDSSVWEELAIKHPEVRWFRVPDGKLTSFTSVEQAQGVCAVFGPTDSSWERLLACPFLIVAWDLADPGNLGTLIRTCAALTDGGLLLLGGCSPWSSKVARSSAGALFRVPILREPTPEGVIERLGGAGYKVFATAPVGGKDPREASFSGRDAVVLGNESRGLPAEILRSLSPLTIPMKGSVESLNVAMVGGLLAYCWSVRHFG